jgi:hypothetical protein
LLLKKTIKLNNLSNNKNKQEKQFYDPLLINLYKRYKNYKKLILRAYYDFFQPRWLFIFQDSVSGLRNNGGANWNFNWVNDI